MTPPHLSIGKKVGVQATLRRCIKPGVPHSEAAAPVLAAPSTRRGPHTPSSRATLAWAQIQPSQPHSAENSKTRLSYMLRQAAPCQLCPSPIMCHAPQARRPACLPEEVHRRSPHAIERAEPGVPRLHGSQDMLDPPDAHLSPLAWR